MSVGSETSNLGGVVFDFVALCLENGVRQSLGHSHEFMHAVSVGIYMMTSVGLIAMHMQSAGLQWSAQLSCSDPLVLVK